MTRRTLLGTLLASLAVLVAIGVAEILDPPVKSRAAVDVPYDFDGPIIQPFEAHGFEGWLVRQPDGSVRAFSAAEPRTACPVAFIDPDHPWYRPNNEERPTHPGYFSDPCWGSKWTLAGERTYGPSWRGLDSFEVSDIRGDFITLDVSRMMLGCVQRESSIDAHSRMRRSSDARASWCVRSDDHHPYG